MVLFTPEFCVTLHGIISVERNQVSGFAVICMKLIEVKL